MRPRALVIPTLLAAALMISAGRVDAQSRSTVEGQSLTDALTILKALSDRLDIKKVFKEVASDPEVLNSALDAVLGKAAPGRILANLNVRFATIAPSDSGQTGLGLTYSLSHALKQEMFSAEAASARGLDFRVVAEGNVAFDRKVNPRDFLKSDAALAFFFSRGGAVATDIPARARLDTLRQALALIQSEEELESSPLLEEYMRTVMQHMTTQTHVDFGVTFGLESDQSFQQKQLVYGGRVGLDIKPWNPTTSLAQWNIFDWPFAAVRYLNGTDRTFSPRGSAFPALLVGLALVDPVDDDGREALGAAGSYTRATLESAMSTDFVTSPAGPLTVQIDVRWYLELGAPAAIKSARLDKFSYLTAALVSEQGPFVSYSKGRLPVDLRKNEVYALGFKMHF